MPLLYPSGAHGAVLVEGDGDFFYASHSAGAKSKLYKETFFDVVAEVLVEDEIAERVVDWRAKVDLMVLHHMWMRADDGHSASVDKSVRKVAQVLRGGGFVFYSPMRVDDRQVSLFFGPHD